MQSFGIAVDRSVHDDWLAGNGVVSMLIEVAMKKIVLAALMVVSPLFAHAVDINVDVGDVRVHAPGVNVTFGSRDVRGYYWDGYDYRDPSYWKQHNGPRGEKYYTGHGNNGVPHQGGGHCPPGQAKKGRC